MMENNGEPFTNFISKNTHNQHGFIPTSKIVNMKKPALLILLFITGIASKAQTGSEIYLFDISNKKGKISLSSPVNATNHPGYDNQPFFHTDRPMLYYASFNDDGRSDILSYDYSKKKRTPITQTSEREYSPTLTPDKKYLSCIIQRDNNEQNLGKYPVDGGDPIVLIDNLIVGYHAWLDDDRVLMFILGEPMTLHLYNVKTKEDKIITENIGRSIHRIPNENAMSFVQKQSESEWIIKKLDNKAEAISVITATLPGREDLAWMPDGTILMSDGTKLLQYNSGKSKDWEEVVTNFPAEVKGITRLAVSADGKKLALVVSEE